MLRVSVLRVVVTALAVVLTLIPACAPADSAPDPAAAAHQVLAGARRAVGGDSVLAGIGALRTSAEVRGPSSVFATTVWSARDGRMRMAQTTGFLGGIDRDGGWVRDRTAGTITPADTAVLQFLRGHELHALILMPLTRLRDPVLVGLEPWRDDTALVLQFADPYGAPVFLAYSPRDTLPLGLRLAAVDPDVEVHLERWTTRGHLRLFEAAEFVQDREIHRYDFVEVDLQGVADSVLSRPSR